MWLIDRHSDGLGTSRITLPEPLKRALVRWYVGEGSRHDEAAGITLVQQARVGERWIACDCLGAVDPPPILTPAFLSEAETYYLRRLTSAKRPEHLDQCPFFRDQATNRITDIRNAQTPFDPPAGFFEVLRPAPEKLAQRPDEDSSDDRTRSASIPRLARLLWRLLNASRLNCVGPYRAEPVERTIISEFSVLCRAAAKIEIAPGIALDRALWTHGMALHSGRAFAGLRELARQWPPGHAPQGFLAVFAQEFKGATIHAAGCKPITVANQIQSPSVRSNPVKGPYLIIAVIGEYPERNGYAPLRAYAQPIFSGNRFIPVETDFERTILRALLEVRRSLAKQGMEVMIEKPVFDMLTPLGSCRPDFLVAARSRNSGEIRQIIVQAAGTTGSDRQPPEGPDRCLAQIAPILRVRSTDFETGRGISRISRALVD